MTLPVKLGLNLSAVQPRLLADYAILAEDLGFESLWLGEHIAIPVADDWWQGPEQDKHLAVNEPEHRKPFYPNSAFLDPLVALSHIAALTRRVRLGTGIYMIALRHAIATARMVAALDLLSKGRLEFGIGLGWLPDEYAFLGQDWAQRGSRTDEAIRCVQALLSQEAPSFAGEHFNFPPIGFEPKPVQSPVPILIGGDSPAAFRRAGRLGNGWYGAPASNAKVREELDRAGRGDAPFSYSSISVGAVTRADLDAAAALGTTRCVVTPWKGRKAGEAGPEGLGELERFAAEIGLGG